jgi:RimJ/RimL family protein N-acetyltransferase
MLAVATNRLILRQPSIDQIAGYSALWTAPTPAMPGVPAISPLTPEEAWARLLRFVGHWAVFGFGPFLVLEREASSVVGEVGFGLFCRGHGPDFDATPEAMWKVDYRSQGKGFALEATRAAAKWFDQQQFATRTVCMIDPHNYASHRIADQLGFRKLRATTYRNNPVSLLERIIA